MKKFVLQVGLLTKITLGCTVNKT